MLTERSATIFCNPEIVEHGILVATLDTLASSAEVWVESIARKVNARIDFHWKDGYVQVLHLGDEESRARVCAAIHELRSSLKGKILWIASTE